MAAYYTPSTYILCNFLMIYAAYRYFNPLIFEPPPFSVST